MAADRPPAATDDTSSADESADRDALRRENRRLRSRVDALERTLNEHERRRQSIVDQYELVLDRRAGESDPDRRGARTETDHRSDRTDGDRRTARDDASPETGSDGRSIGPVALVRRTLGSTFE